MDGQPSVLLRPTIRTAFDPGSRQDVDALRNELASEGRNVTLRMPDPGKFAVQTPESVSVYILAGVTTQFLSLLLADISDSIKRWLVRRFNKDDKASAQTVTIYVHGKAVKSILGRSADDIEDVSTYVEGWDATATRP
ncbi:hypothetical protein MINTM020_12310 [Mycobacterium paraintracellulare]|uniref:hypothetical protein n=1 Tax=Mycobacterium paraintracellulare TaxID=1138383 RepID=UPI0019376625|nr:hypothetical protein [Mycobacterium paraintracellulare]BCP09133.1 hypothetical protein MINTM020_12310 [Mycobacterium paraintracellulare]